MTAESVTPYRSQAQVGRDGFAQLVRAEWTKFRTVRGWVIGMLVMVALTVLIGLAGPLGSSIGCVGPAGTVCHRQSPPTGPGGVQVSDNFFFAHQPLTGNGTITVRVTSLTGLHPDLQGSPDDQGTSLVPGTVPWSKAGIIVKDGTGQGSTYAAMMVTGGNGVRMQYDFTHDTAGIPGAVSTSSPRWLRLSRSGSTIIGYDSTDGAHWTEVGTATLTGLPTTVQAGLFAASPDYTVTQNNFGGSSGQSTTAQAIGTFDNVGLQGGWGAGGWTGTVVGGSDNDPALPAPGFTPAPGGYTVAGSGDIAPFVVGDGGLQKTVGDALVGAFAGLIAAIVVAAMFITAEYRRGMIRVTLAASPRRGRVLAAKAVVVAGVTFVAGLVSAAIAIPLIEGIEQRKGYYLYPTALVTEVRVIVGTAAVLAVASVLALAVGTIVRRSAAAVAAVIALIIVPYILGVASVLPLGPALWMLRLTPAAAFAVQQSQVEYHQVATDYLPGAGFFPLAPWAGFSVLCAYAVAALTLAFVLVRRRDA